MKFGTLFCSLCIYFAHLSAEIIEFSSFKDLSSHIAQDTLLILDIDDTLLVPVQMLGCDEWFQHRCRQWRQNGETPKTAFEKALAEWVGVRHISDMELVEWGTDELIRDAQKSGVHVMGLTTQDFSTSFPTTRHLNKQNIDLSLTAPSAKDHYFQIVQKGVLYKNGILFTDGSHKGKALFHLLDLIGYQPAHIVFVNDKASHLTEIETVAQEKDIAFVGLRYSYSDARKAAFRPEVAEYQFHNSSFNRLLSDKEAMQRLEQMTP